ncbi:hypothetical protein N7501_005460 [Penicillium viridicatum]|nr:hypothetical protein N7465_005052 [Penicillium sp. CMV-2018d]KAJ5969212.1 hypothetical protein N7501_005460 [Penicillium viridicatum]
MPIGPARNSWPQISRVRKIANLPRNAIPEDDRERQPRASPKPPTARADAGVTKAFKTSQVDPCALSHLGPGAALHERSD